MSELSKKLAGKFIVIDGPDGAGKSTQLKLLAERLLGADVAVTQVRDPGGTAIGDRIREILLDNAHADMAVETELMLYMASRAQLVAQTIRPALQRGQCVLSDRYISSTVAYQGAGGVDPAAVQQAGKIATGGLLPDLTVVLDLPSDVGLGRAKNVGDPDRMESKALEFHQRVRQSFLDQAAAEPGRFAVVDGSRELHEVAGNVWEALAARFGE
ncbi:MAG: dTMP kinase [Phycisphaerae bacterium]